jgi:hypothetical protein
LEALNPTLADLVHLAFGDVQDPPLPVSFPDFLTAPLDEWPEVEMCLEAIGTQNSFEPRAVARELLGVFPELMEVRVGRQEDVVIVVSIPFWTHQAIEWRDDGAGRRLRRDEREALAHRVAAAFERSGGGVGSLVDDDMEDAPAVIEVSGHWALS